MKVIKLPVYQIEIHLSHDPSESEDPPVGEIFLLGVLQQGGDVEPRESPTLWEAALDGILSMVLAHACAGIDVESTAYLEGLEVAFDSMVNSYGD